VKFCKTMTAAVCRNGIIWWRPSCRREKIGRWGLRSQQCRGRRQATGERSSVALCNGRERVPIKWTPLIDRTRLKIRELERVRIEKAEQLLRDMRLNRKTCGRNYWLDHDRFNRNRPRSHSILFCQKIITKNSATFLRSRSNGRGEWHEGQGRFCSCRLPFAAT
jgi:hypothetical protein